MSALDHDLSRLTRESLEATFRVQRCKLEAEEMKLETLRDIVREMIEKNENDLKSAIILRGKNGEPEVINSLKKIISYINMNPQALYPEIGHFVNDRGLVEVEYKSNRVALAFVLGAGISLGALIMALRIHLL